MQTGYIYVMTNSEVSHLVKIGYTTRTVKDRAKELSSGTGVPGKWVPKRDWLINHPEKYEKIIHKELAKYRKGGAELYNLSLESAVNYISIILKIHNVIDENGMSDVEKIIVNKRLRLLKITESIDELNKNVELFDEKVKEFDKKIESNKREILTISEEINSHIESSKFTPKHIYATFIVILIGFFIPLIYLLLIYGFWDIFIKDHKSIIATLKLKGELLNQDLNTANKQRKVFMDSQMPKDELLSQISKLKAEFKEINQEVSSFYNHN